MTEDGTGLAPAWVAQTVVTYDELCFAQGALWWLQSDPDHGGRRRLMRSFAGSTMPVTSPEFSVGGQLHAYGGGSFVAAPGGVWFIDDGSLFHLPTGGTPVCVATGDDQVQYGDLALSWDGLPLAVRGGNAADEIVSVSRTGHAEVLVRSSGFLASPRLAPGMLAYLEWGRDQMPWDSSRLLLAPVRHDAVKPGVVIAGDGQESVTQPSWGPDGRLHFMSDRTGWWNLYRWNGVAEAIAPIDADCAPAPWEGGYQSYGFTPRGEIVLTTTDGIATELLLVNGPDRRRIASNLTSIKPYVAATETAVSVIGSTPTSSPSIWSVDPAAGSNGRARLVVPEPSSPSPWTVSPPSVETVETINGPLRFLLHRPDDTGAVPLIVRAHPGPTDDVPLRLDWTTQFFISHGFAIAEVLYRGSTGQGRAFRQSLHGHWGEYDVDDCAAVGEHLLAVGVVLRGALFISGASAGGYTALQAACRPSPFSAATATSAIIDPARWERSVPPFQRPHAAVLRGPAGAAVPDHVRVPVLVIHGTADTITSADDARRFASVLSARDRNHESVFLAGGDHYLSDPASRQQALGAELGFYQRIMRRGTG
ncbi:prolyl oligopeptidase family serine peptidase [Kitasatospora sp. NPDC017646]|uniref:S9 family peptidase n=1 Tax=Kitasatospora sp. NPDC017646 TaxID=3364024 RepID=UPI0037BA8710